MTPGSPATQETSKATAPKSCIHAAQNKTECGCQPHQRMEQQQQGPLPLLLLPLSAGSDSSCKGAEKELAAYRYTTFSVPLCFCTPQIPFNY